MIDDETCNWALREILRGEPSLGDISGEARTTSYENRAYYTFTETCVTVFVHSCTSESYARQNGFTVNNNQTPGKLKCKDAACTTTII